MQRIRLGVTQEECARALGVPVGSWVRWEAGRSQPSSEYERMIQVLPALITGKYPEPCAIGKQIGFSPALAEHLRGCKECQRLITVLNVLPRV
jgi:DNA-binding XRE family transcriptional regulator